MGWAIWLELDAGGEEPIVPFESHRITHNTNDMFRAVLKATGQDLIDLHDLNMMNAGEQAPILEGCVEWLESEKGKKVCAPMHPPNNWGSRESLSKTLAKIAEECRQVPKASVRWWG